MEVDDWALGLVFEATDGSFHEEFRRHHATLPEALALARRDAVASEFGRTFRGFSMVELASSVSGTLRPRKQDTNSVKPLADLLAKHQLHDEAETVAAESPRHAVAFEGLERFPWWDFEGAFGMATEVGVALGRCASTKPDEAAEAAHLVGASIARQTQLYPVSAPTLPYLVALLESKDISCRPILVGWLSVLAKSAKDAIDGVSTVLTWAARLVARDLAETMAAHRRSAKEVQTALRELRPRLTVLEGDPLIGATVKAITRML